MINDTEFDVPDLPCLWSNTNKTNNKRKKHNTFNDEAAPATSNSPQSTNHIISSTNHQIALASNYHFNPIINPINKDGKKVPKKRGNILQKSGSYGSAFRNIFIQYLSPRDVQHFFTAICRQIPFDMGPIPSDLLRFRQIHILH